MDNLDAKKFLEIIDKRMDGKVPTQVSKGYSATVISISGGKVTVHLPTDPVGNNIVVQNSRDLPLEVGDEVYIVALDGKLSNAFVDFRKTIDLNNIYVDFTTGTDTYGYNSNGYQYGSINAPFKTLNFAVRRLSKNTNRRLINIYYNTLNSAEEVFFVGFYGGGIINIRPLSGTSITNISFLQVNGCAGIRVNIYYLGFTRTNYQAVEIFRSNFIALFFCHINTSSSFEGIVVADGSIAVISDCTIANRSVGILASGVSQIFSSTNTGANTSYGLRADFSSTVGKFNTQPTGGIANEIATTGSVIR